MEVRPIREIPSSSGLRALYAFPYVSGMFPTVALIMTGTTSVGTLTAFAVNKYSRCDQESTKEGDIHEGTQNRNT